mmetsp:Transcript_71/g.162  ORF Transcript_71/g.162 Transcript_71/m.162 type:complete len:217 (+) Transcript_71:364-1014(+)
MAGQAQKFLQPVLQPIDDPLVACGLIPHAQNVLVSPHGYDRPANLTVGNVGNPSPQQREHDLLPVPGTQQSLLRQPDGPPPAGGIVRILPGRLDALSKEMIIGRGGKIVRTDEVVVDGPKFLDRPCCPDEFDSVSERSLVGERCLGVAVKGSVALLTTSHIVEGVAGLKWRACHFSLLLWWEEEVFAKAALVGIDCREVGRSGMKGEFKAELQPTV